MDNTKKFIAKELSDLCNSFKAMAILAMLLVEKRDFDTVYSYHKQLIKMYEDILIFIKSTCSKEICDKIENEDFDGLPDYLDYIKIANTYKKMAANKYFANVTEFGKIKEQIMLCKMSLDLDNKQEAPFISIANNLYKMKKYPEAVKIFSFIDKYTNFAPTLQIMGKLYQKTGKYDMAIECYHRLLTVHKEHHVANNLRRLYLKVFS